MFARVLLLLQCCLLYKEQVLPYLIDCYPLLSYSLHGYSCSIFESIFDPQSHITEGRKLSVISVCSVWKCFCREEILSDKQLMAFADNWLLNRSFGSTLIQFGNWKSCLLSGSTLSKLTVILNTNIIKILNVERNIHVIYVIIHWKLLKDTMIWHVTMQLTLVRLLIFHVFD